MANPKLAEIIEAKKSLEEVVRIAKREVAKEAFNIIKDASFDKPVLNISLAKEFGIDPSLMAEVMRKASRLPVTSRHIEVVTRFAEIDENGALIPDGATKTTSRKLLAYYPL